MAKEPPTADKLEAIRQELALFLERFDVTDAEDAQVRTDALISSMVNAGVLKDSGARRGFRLDTALERVQLPLAKREALVSRAEMFRDLISSYDGEPDQSDMERAENLLQEIADALNAAIDAKMKKRAG